MKHKLLTLSLLLCALIVGSGTIWGQDYENVATFTSETVVTASSYSSSYETDDWNLTFGGNNASMGTNKNNSSKCKISQNYGTDASTTNIATAAVSKNKLDKVSQITFVHTSGSGNSGKIYFAYSTDGSTWNAITLTTGTQGANTPAVNTTMTVRFAEISSAYYAVILDKGNATAANFRFDYVTITFDKQATPSYTITAQSNNDSFGTVSLSGSVITATPAEGYRVKSGDEGYTVTSGTATVVNNGDNTFSVTPTSNCTVRVNFEAIPTHTVTYSINGNTDTTEEFAEGATITFPPNPADIEGKKFTGWVATTIDGTTNVEPSYVSSPTMANSDVTYYAVFADAEGSSETKTDNLTTSTFGSPSSYTSWEDKKASNGSNAVYSGNSSTYNNSAIQLRSGTSSGSNVHSGIVTTTSGGKAKKVTITWNSNTIDDRTLDVYGKNTAYNSREDLYGETPGTSLGSIVKGTSTVLNITGDYAYIGLRSNSGAMYITQIAIDWEVSSISYSAFCTTVSALPVPTIEFKNSSNETITSIDVTAQDMEEVSVECSAGNVDISVTSDDDTIAEYEEGNVMGYKYGTTTLTATFAGNGSYQGTSATLTVIVSRKTTTTTIEVEIDDTDIYTATEGGLAVATVKAGESNVPSASVTWTSSATNVATIDSDGKITLVGAGTTTITASYAGSDIYDSSEGTYELTLKDSTPQASEIDITFGNALYGTSYTGTGAANNGPFSGSVNNVSVTVNQGSGSNLYITDLETRIYGGTTKGTITLTAPSGYLIRKIEITKNDNKWDVGVNEGTLTNDETENSATWEGSASEVIFSASGRSDFYSATVTLAEAVTVGTAGYASYVTKHNVEFPEGVTGYIVTSAGDNIHLSSRASVPAGTPIIVKATAKTYPLPVITEDPDDVTGNLLLESDGNVTGDGSTIYVLANKSKGIGFYLLADGQKVTKGKAYLDTSVQGAPQFLGLDDETTGIDSLNGDRETLNDGAIYDLAGRRITNGQSSMVNVQSLPKGIYIQNGKKFIVK